MIDRRFLTSIYCKSSHKTNIIKLFTFLLILLFFIPKTAFSKTEYLFYSSIDGFSDQLSFGKISAFALYKNEIYVADSRRQEIFIFDLQGNPLFSFGVESNLSGQPEAIVISNEKIFIKINGKNTIDVFNILGKMITKIPAPYEEFQPGSIAAVDDSGLLVFDKNLGKICLFDEEGKFVSSFSIKDRIQTVSGVAYNKGRIFIASANREMAIHIYNMKGEFQSGFGRVGNSEVDFSIPSNIRFDKEGVLWVVDALKHRVSGYDDKGNSLGTIRGEWTHAGSFDFPHDVYFSEDMVYILETGINSITVLKKEEKPEK